MTLVESIKQLYKRGMRHKHLTKEEVDTLCDLLAIYFTKRDEIDADILAVLEGGDLNDHGRLYDAMRSLNDGT